MDTHISHLAHLDGRDDAAAADLPSEDGPAAPVSAAIHVPPRPPVDHAPRVLLPGEGPPSEPVDPEAVASGVQGIEPASRPGARRGGPRLAVAAIAVVAVLSVATSLTFVHHRQPALAPLALDRPAPGTLQAPASRPIILTKTQVGHPHPVIPGAQDDMRSVMALQAGAQKTSPPVTTHPTAVHAAPIQVSSSKPPAAPPVVVTDPTQVLAGADIKPMSRQQQADVLQMVTRLGALVRDLRVENMARERQLEAFSKVTGDRLSDLDQRLSLEEAHASVDGAAAAGTTPAPNPATEAKTLPRSSSSSASLPSPPLMAARPAAPLRNLSAFRIQAASPGLAVLQVNSPGLDEPGILQVAVGDSIPGLGNILSIAQRGIGWEVRTDRGVIR